MFSYQCGYFVWSLFDCCFKSSSLRLLLGTEAPVRMPNGVDISFFSVVWRGMPVLNEVMMIWIVSSV